MLDEGACIRLQLTSYTTGCDGELDGWKHQHQEAMQCYRIEELIQVGLACYAMIDGANLVWRRHVAREERPFDAGIDDQFKGLFRDWRSSTTRVLESAVELRKRGFDVSGLDELVASSVAADVRLEEWTPPKPSVFPSFRTIRSSIEAAERLRARTEQAVRAHSLDALEADRRGPRSA